MKYVGYDLHKQSVTVCVVNHVRKMIQRKRLLRAQPDAIKNFFEKLGEFRAVVEATASYE